MTEHSPFPTFQRRSDRRVIAGLSTGVADAFDVDPAYVRSAFVILTLAGGIGAVMYGLGWLMTIERASDQPLPPVVKASGNPLYRSIGFQVAVVGCVLFAASNGLTIHPSILWPVTLMALGIANVWSHGDEQSREWLQGVLSGSDPSAAKSGRAHLTRLIAGGALAGLGVVLFITSTDTFSGAGIVVVSASITVIGLAIVLGPYVWRLWKQLADERTERIRSEQKTEIAAHLHDSVLQTLALIQSTSDPEQQAVLARIQERELRSWLFGDDDQTDATLKVMMEAAAAEVEKRHQVAVEAVTVGDTDVNSDVAALVAAAREALINAAKHSGRRSVSLYTEVEDDRIEVFITDQGNGFDPKQVGDDRIGIAESITGRMQRHGGAATITSSRGEGTEVHLTLPIGGAS